MRLPAGTQLVDPEPAATARRDVELVERWSHGATAVVGWSSGGWERSSSPHGTPTASSGSCSSPRRGATRSVDWLDGVTAKTLLLYGSADPETGSSHARWWQRRLANARVEMNPGGGHDLLAPTVAAHPLLRGAAAPRKRG